MRQFSCLLPLAALVMVSACATTTNLKELRHLTPQGTPYAMALTKEYLRFSEEEAAACDWEDSSYFAEKGLMSGYGETIVLPEKVEEWNVPEDMKPELQTAREKLLALTNEMSRANNPQAAATATIAFDRWLEKAEEGWNGKDISALQQKFYTALEALEFDALAAAEAADAARESGDDEVIPKGGKTSSTAYLVYFGHGKITIDNEARQILKQAAADINAAPPTSVVINGHTDSTGEQEFNLKLSEKRALSVLKELIRNGVPAKILKYFAFGESDPAIDVGDNKHEPRNRRAEIFLG